MTATAAQAARSQPARPVGRVRAPKPANRLETASSQFEPKIYEKYVRVWAAPNLHGLLPADRHVPNHCSNDDIDTDYSAGLDYVTCRTCEMHTDWHQLFEYVVMRGSGTLWVGHEVDELHQYLADEKTKTHRVKIEPGDVIQLWPMAPHRVTCRSTMTLLSIKDYADTQYQKFRGLPKPETTVTRFKKLIRENYKP